MSSTSTQPHERTAASFPKFELAVALAALALAAVWGYGAMQLPSESGYAGIGADFVPWVATIAVATCGVFLLWEVLTGGFRFRDEPSGSAHASGWAFVWVSAGIILNAVLIQRIGFILSCTLCFVLAVRGLRAGQGKAHGDLRQTVIDVVIGLCLSAPVFWLFGKGLNVTLPGLTQTGWL